MLQASFSCHRIRNVPGYGGSHWRRVIYITGGRRGQLILTGAGRDVYCSSGYCLGRAPTASNAYFTKFDAFFSGLSN